MAGRSALLDIKRSQTCLAGAVAVSEMVVHSFVAKDQQQVSLRAQNKDEFYPSEMHEDKTTSS